MDARPALQTSSTQNPIDISYTDNATHVYVKVSDPKGLNSKFEGPYFITSRPSRSTVQVRVGSFADGSPRHQVFHWSLCKIAHMRDGALEGSRPKLGRKPLPKPPDKMADDAIADDSQLVDVNNQSSSEPAKIQTAPNQNSSETMSSNPHPDYVRKGPLVTQTMFDQANWPQILGLPSSSRPVRASRNPNPRYVDSVVS